MPTKPVIYACTPNDYARHRLIFHPNGRFVVDLAYVNEHLDITQRKIYAGHYGAGTYVYDMSFETLNKSQIAEIFRGSLGGFIPKTHDYRITKIPYNLYVGGCRMQLQGSGLTVQTQR